MERPGDYMKRHIDSAKPSLPPIFIKVSGKIPGIDANPKKQTLRLRFVCRKLLGSSPKNDTYERWAKQVGQREILNGDIVATDEFGARIAPESCPVLRKKKRQSLYDFSMKESLDAGCTHPCSRLCALGQEGSALKGSGQSTTVPTKWSFSERH